MGRRWCRVAPSLPPSTSLPWQHLHRQPPSPPQTPSPPPSIPPQGPGQPGGRQGRHMLGGGAKNRKKKYRNYLTCTQNVCDICNKIFILIFVKFYYSKRNIKIVSLKGAEIQCAGPDPLHLPHHLHTYLHHYMHIYIICVYTPRTRHPPCSPRSLSHAATTISSSPTSPAPAPSLPHLLLLLLPQQHHFPPGHQQGHRGTPLPSQLQQRLPGCSHPGRATLFLPC